tara:strand:- start:1854 stop:2135 length:282 start_codon:yes stop_codon:yes gene_type:complete
MSFSINQQIAAVRLLNIKELCELNEFVVSEIKRKRSLKGLSIKSQLSEGVDVSFKDRHGTTLSGSIVKVMRKFARVQVGNITWRVPMSALTIK